MSANNLEILGSVTETVEVRLNQLGRLHIRQLIDKSAAVELFEDAVVDHRFALKLFGGRNFISRWMVR